MSFPVPTPPDAPAPAKVLEAERELEHATSGRPQDPTRLAAAFEQAVDSCRRWPEATAGVFYLPELLGHPQAVSSWNSTCARTRRCLPHS
jgi:hypothetical protein